MKNLAAKTRNLRIVVRKFLKVVALTDEFAGEFVVWSVISSTDRSDLTMNGNGWIFK